MRFTRIEMQGLRGFKQPTVLDFSNKINIFTGPNNSGKSTLIRCLFTVQNHSSLSSTDVTLGVRNGGFTISLDGYHENSIPHHCNRFKAAFQRDSGRQHVYLDPQGNATGAGQISSVEPHNLIYPYLSNRKVPSFDDTINGDNANSVLGNFTHLYSKIDRLVVRQFQPAHDQYIQACNDILGFEVSTLAKGNGKHAVYYVKNAEHIPLTAMGEGVVNMLGLITDLCVAEDRIFLLEEPENDIHPKALKALLRLIQEKSNTNQYFISTHSNIVVRYLGAAPDSKVFSVSSAGFDTSLPKLGLSRVSEVANNAVDRIRLLEDLGYDHFDFNLWKAWLFLEESSAEVIIREYLIPWFASSVASKLRTYSSSSLSQVKPKFEEFNSLFVFLHLEPTYKNRVWVCIDGGEQEKAVIDELQKTYVKSGWDPTHFSQFSKHDFEQYYPPRFADEVAAALAEPDKSKKWTKKRALTERVKVWCASEPALARSEFEKSAAEVVQYLRHIEAKIDEHR